MNIYEFRIIMMDKKQDSQKMAESNPTAIAGMTSDRRIVFSSGLDEVGRKVVRQAKVGVAGLLDDGALWFLHTAEKSHDDIAVNHSDNKPQHDSSAGLLKTTLQALRNIAERSEMLRRKSEQLQADSQRLIHDSQKLNRRYLSF